MRSIFSLSCNMTRFFKNVITPISLLVGTIIGAGLFALPFVFYAAGFIPTIIYILLFSALAAFVHVLYTDIIFRTQETHHQFPGYVRIYFGKYMGQLASAIVSTTILLTLTAYLILSISFLSLIFPALSPWIATFIFWLLGSLIIFTNVKKTALFGAITGIATTLMIGALFMYLFIIHSGSVVAVSAFESSSVLMPFGPILFALTGFSAIPALVEYSRKERVSLKTLRRTIIAGTFIAGFFYFLFTIAVWGLSSTVSPDSVSGMARTLPPVILFLWGIFGFVLLWYSYAAVGRDLFKIMENDWELHPTIAMAGVFLLPPFLYLLGIKNFVGVISVIGAILIGTGGILLVATWLKASRVDTPSIKFSRLHTPKHSQAILHEKPSVVPIIIIAIFLSGIVYELANLMMR